MALLTLENYTLGIGQTPILKDINLALEPSEIHGLIGESGSGKSLTALSVMQLLPGGAHAQGVIRFDGHEITSMNEADMCALRGDDIGMIFQEPMTALNPLHSIEKQIGEVLRLHQKMSEDKARIRGSV